MLLVPWVLLMFLVTRAGFSMTTTKSDVLKAIEAAALHAQVKIIGLSHTADPKTIYTAQIEKLMRAHPHLREGDEIQIEIPGGPVHGGIIQYSGLATAMILQRYQIAATPGPNGNFQINGADSGFVPTSKSRTFVRNQVDGCAGSDPAYVHWDFRFMPVPFSINADSFLSQPDLVDAIAPSFQTWRDVAGLGVEFIPLGCTDSPVNENDGINNIILITKNWGFMPEAIAVTRNFFIGCQSAYAGQILDSDILLNGVNHRFSIGPVDGRHDIQNILTHEIGHLLGMGHETDDGDKNATMYKDADFKEIKKRTLKASDIQGIRKTYPMAFDKGDPHSGIACHPIQPKPFACSSVNSQPSNDSDSLFGMIFWAMVWVVVPVGLVLGRRLWARS